MKNIAVLNLALMFLLFPVTKAEAGKTIGLSDVIHALEAPFQQKSTSATAVNDFDADFFQESRIASLDRVQEGSGRVSVKFDRSVKAGPHITLFRWTYEKPTIQEIVSDGSTMWVYMPENNQVIKSDIKEALKSGADNPLSFLTGLGNLSRDFLISWAQPNLDANGNYVLELRPRHSSPVIERLLFVVNRSAILAGKSPKKPEDLFPLKSTTVFDPNNNQTHIEFHNVKINQNIPDEKFKFEPPEGVEILQSLPTIPAN